MYPVKSFETSSLTLMMFCFTMFERKSLFARSCTGQAFAVLQKEWEAKVLSWVFPEGLVEQDASLL